MQPCRRKAHGYCRLFHLTWQRGVCFSHYMPTDWLRANLVGRAGLAPHGTPLSYSSGSIKIVTFENSPLGGGNVSTSSTCFWVLTFKFPIHSMPPRLAYRQGSNLHDIGMSFMQFSGPRLRSHDFRVSSKDKSNIELNLFFISLLIEMSCLLVESN